jgi:Ion channel
VATPAVIPDSRRLSVQGQHRYGVVFVLVLVLVLFEITAPSGSGSRAVDVALAGAALTVTVATSRAGHRVRRIRSIAVAAFAAIFVIGIAAGAFGLALTFAVIALLLVFIPVALAGGILRLVRQAGVTYEVVAGALTIYLIVGLLFGAIILFVARVETGPYFHQSGVSTGDVVYYSFTAMTTTGFGDYTAATPFGHALAVLEMLTGQLYLVTVIGIVVGNYAGRRANRASDERRAGAGEAA